MVMHQGLKILINGGYGLFGDESFKYYDVRVADLITAYGRYSLSKMQKIAELKGFEIVGGDTDSLFLLDVKSDNNNKQAISESKEKIGIDVEVNTTFSKAVITKKKHYFGVTDKGDIIVDALRIWVELSRNPEYYKINNIQKKIGLQLGAKAGDLIYYYKSKICKVDHSQTQRGTHPSKARENWLGKRDTVHTDTNFSKLT